MNNFHTSGSLSYGLGNVSYGKAIVSLALICLGAMI